MPSPPTFRRTDRYKDGSRKDIQTVCALLDVLAIEQEVIPVDVTALED
jgi:hypothetical protein